LINDFLKELKVLHIWIDDKLYIFQDNFILTEGIIQEEHFILFTDNTNSHKFFSTSDNVKFDNIEELKKIVLDIQKNGSTHYLKKEE
jgi:hypothetical protein